MNRVRVGLRSPRRTLLRTGFGETSFETGLSGTNRGTPLPTRNRKWVQKGEFHTIPSPQIIDSTGIADPTVLQSK
jgi:hypothetical protein